MSRSRNHPEQAFQASLMKTLGMVLERETMVFAVPNGGARSGIEAAIMVSQGVIPGIPDLIVLWDGRAAGLECKAGDRRLASAVSDNQSALAPDKSSPQPDGCGSLGGARIGGSA